MNLSRVFSLLFMCCIYSFSSWVFAHDHAQNNVNLYVGTFDGKGSEGVFSVSVNAKTGEFSGPEKIIKATSPSFLAQSNKNILYAVVREGEGMLGAYIKNKEKNKAGYTLLNKQPTEGASPCYIALNKDQTFIATANYMGGSTSIFSLDDNGKINPKPTVVKHEGKSVTPRQEAPHAHWVQWSKWDDSHLYVVDLGIDEVKKYSFDAASGHVTKVETAIKTQAGAGPRQMVYHPSLRMVFILNELDNTLVAATVNTAGLFETQQVINTLPKTFKGHNQASHIEITSDGKTIYTSNRGHNSIARFSVSDKGELTFKGTVSTQGDWPRYFALLEEEKLMLVANRKTHDIYSFHVQPDGKLVPTGHKVKVKWPSYIAKAQH